MGLLRRGRRFGPEAPDLQVRRVYEGGNVVWEMRWGGIERYPVKVNGEWVKYDVIVGFL